MDFGRLFSRAAFVLVVLAGCLLFVGPATAYTNAVVGNGTPGSCTEAEFNAKLAIVQGPPDYDGQLSFNCGGPATIIFTSQKVIDTQLIVIDGGGVITLSGGNSTRLFHAVSGTLDLRNITLTNGFSGNGYGGAILAQSNAFVYLTDSTIQNSRTNDGYGGAAILSFDQHPVGPSVSIENSVISGNTSEYAAVNTIGRLTITNSYFESNAGGGLSVGGPTEIIDSTFVDNSSEVGGAIRVVAGTTEMTGGQLAGNHASVGGAVYNASGLVLRNVDVAANSSTNDGGAVNNASSAYAELHGVTVRDNQSGTDGGAVDNVGFLAAANSTFSDNFAGDSGSELYNRGVLLLDHSTIAGGFTNGNTIFNSESTVQVAVLRFKSTIVLGSGSTGTTCEGKPATSSDFSLYRNNSCPWSAGSGNIITTSPFIVNQLADNGGPTLTHMPFASGPAVDAGQCELDVDQRGVARPQGPACDIGSVEWVPVVAAQEWLFLPYLQR